MSEDEVKDVREVVDAVYRSQSRQVLATLILSLGVENKEVNILPEIGDPRTRSQT